METKRILISKSAKRKCSSKFTNNNTESGKPELITRQKAGFFTEQVVYKTKIGNKYISKTKHEIVR